MNRLVEFLSIFLLGLVTGVSFSHVIQRGPKASLAGAQFLAVQQVLLRNYGPVIGALEVAALLSTLAMAILAWGAVVSTHYSQVSVLRTIEDILGAPHINLNTAYERPMADVFDITSSGAWTYSSVASTVLAATTLSAADIGAKYAAGPVIVPKHDATYWDKVTRGFDFSDADRVPPALYNKVLWVGLMEGKPYPSSPSRYKTRPVDLD